MSIQPNLRPIQMSPIRHEGNLYIMLHDSLGMTEGVILIPQALAPLLDLCDGTRNLSTLRTAFELRTGIPLSVTVLETFISRLDEALLLDNERFAAAHDTAVSEFRAAPTRPPAIAGKGYPADPAELREMINGCLDALPARAAGDESAILDIQGLISPHIDFQRGGMVYAQVWQKAATAIQEAELVIILGTDHLDGRHLFTLTKQHYSTPWGILPTAGDVVDRIAAAVGSDVAFHDELHHLNEHSIELAAIWLHYFLAGGKCELVPVLCGSFDRFTAGGDDPSRDDQIMAMIDACQAVAGSRRTLIIAAVDLAHMGPAFGDSHPIDAIERAVVTAADERLIEAICATDADGFFAQIKREDNRRRICGLAPIYMALRLLDGARGEASGYMHCPADQANTSLVSICGVVLGKKGGFNG